MTHPTPYADIPYFPEDDEVIPADLLSAHNVPIELEIGFGRGHFMLDRARAVPDHCIIGLETRRKGVFTAIERAKKHGIANIRPFHGDAHKALPRMMPDASVARVFIHFPDPWWKVRHEKRMVVCPELVSQAARLLTDGGELFVQTDVDYRAEKYLEVLRACAMLMPQGDAGVVELNPFSARSLREKKCIQTGLPIYRMLFTRRAR
jgi:tRNA (guanine-N7-)-methyltransferase